METVAHDLSSQNMPEYIESDMKFHAVILEACCNELMEQMASLLREPLEVSRDLTIKIPGKAVQAIPAHRAVLNAILKRNPKKAYQAMQNLVDEARLDIEAYFHKWSEYSKRSINE